MTMDIGHLSGFLFSVVKTSVLTAYFAPCLGLWTIFVECVVPIQQTTKKGIIIINKKKAYTEESEFVDG